jgi:hypothetical protein
MAVSLTILLADGSTLQAWCPRFGLSLLFAGNSRHVEAVTKPAQVRCLVDGASLPRPQCLWPGAVWTLNYRSCHLLVDAGTYCSFATRLLLPSVSCDSDYVEEFGVGAVLFGNFTSFISWMDHLASDCKWIDDLAFAWRELESPGISRREWGEPTSAHKFSLPQVCYYL